MVFILELITSVLPAAAISKSIAGEPPPANIIPLEKSTTAAANAPSTLNISATALS